MTFLTMTEKTNSSLAARQSRLLKQVMFALVVRRGWGLLLETVWAQGCC